MSRLSRRISIVAQLLIAVSAVWAYFAQPCAAAPGDLLYSIPNPDSEMYTLFGEVIAATNETIVIGAPQTPVGDHPVAGRAYVYDANDGALRYTLENPEPDVREMFGRSAAIAGGHVVVGSSGLDAAAYVFDEQTGRYQRTITDGTPREDSAFSSSLIGNGPNVLIGSPQHFVDNIQAAGGVFLIDPADGESSQTYENPFPTPFAGFGSHDSVGTSGRHVFVGELYERGPDGWIRGTVWAFDAATGEVAFNVLNPSPESADLPPTSDLYGLVVAADDVTLVVGAELDDPGGVINAGTVYVYDAATGSPRLTLQNPSPSKNDHFGGALAVIDGDILVGATDDTAGEIERTGTAYLFDGWTGELLLTLENPDPKPFNFFSHAVAAIDGKLIIGTLSGLPTNEVFVFEGMPKRISGDTNRDGVVDITDLNNVRNTFGAAGYGLAGDANRDALVDIADLNDVRNHFGEGANQVPEPPAWRIALPSALAATASCALLTRNKLDARLTDDYTGKRAMEVRTL